VKIVVLVKYSMDVAEIRVDPVSQALRMSGVPRRIGDVDKGAVEAAVRLKEAGDATVEVVCFGPPNALGAMKDLLAMGADVATVIEDPYDGAADAAAVTRVIEAAVNKLAPFDLLICGFASDDGYSYQIGPRLAERLGLPLVSYASEVNVDDGVLAADRDLEAGVQTVSVRLPAVVSVAEEAFVPRTVTLLQAMKAQKKPTNLWSLADVSMTREELDEVTTYSALKETGIVVNRQQNVLKDSDLAEMADQLIDWLINEQVLVGKDGA
jgi:electron transfer flavoprotein beta subunit